MVGPFETARVNRSRRGPSLFPQLAFALGLLLLGREAAARNCTWNSATEANFNTSGKWSGGGCSVPGAGDVAIFNNTGTGNCTIAVDPGIGTIQIESGYTGTITVSSAVSVTLSTSFTQAGGTFNGGNGTLRVTGSFSLSGGVFNSTSGRLGVYSFSKTGGTFNHNNGQVMLRGTSSATFASGGATFYNLTVNDGLVGYWKLDEATSTGIADVSGHGNSGSLVNGPTWTTGSSNLPALNFRNPSAVVFDGSNDHATLGVNNLPALNANKSISFWVYYSAVPSTQQTFFSLMSGSAGLQIGFFNTAGARTIRAWNSGSQTLVVAAASTPSSGWHHVVYTRESSLNALYVDGVAVTSFNGVSTGTPTAAYLGSAAGTGEYFAGRIDDVRVYDRPLSSSDVAALYAGYQPATAVVTHTMTGSTTVANDLVVAAGGLAAGSNGLSVAGNWLNYGGTFTGAGTVSFTGSSTGKIIRSSRQAFGALTVSGSGTWTLDDELAMSTRAINVTAGTLDGLSFPIRAGSITESGSGNFTPGTGTVTFDGTSNTTIPDGNYGGMSIDISDSNLVGHWKLDEGSGTTFNDSSGYGNNGSLVNGPGWSTSVSSTIQFTDPYALSITGGSTNDHGSITVSSLSLNPASGVTLAYWMYYPSLPSASSDAVVLKNSGLLQTGYLKATSGVCTGGCIAAWNSGGGGAPLAYKTSPSSSAGWYHFAYTWDGTNSKLYVNGVEATGSTNSPTSNVLNTIYLSTYDGTNEDFSGRLDDVRLYNTALTATQVQRLANGYSTYSNAATYTLGGDTTVTGALSINGGGISVGSRTLTASSGLTVGGNGTLTMATSGGILAIGSGQSLILNGTLNASSTGATIKSVSGNYAFTVGSTASARPTLNINGLAVQNTDTNGMRINADANAVTTFTRFDNIAFSAGTGTQLLQIYAPSLYLTSTGTNFDAGATKSTTYNVVLTGNGTADGETRIVFGGATCATDVASCQAWKSDDDANNDGVGSNTATNGAVVQFTRGTATDTAGSIVGFPTTAFDWNTFQYYSTYVAYSDASGTVDRVYVRGQDGGPKSGYATPYWDTPSGETLIGTPRWNTIGGVHYVFVATTSGKVYRLVDNTSAGTLTQDSSGNWAGANNPFDCSCTIVTPLALDANNLYWGGIQTSQKLWTLGQASRSQPFGSPLTISVSGSPAVTGAAPAFYVDGGTTYIFLGLVGHVVKLTSSSLIADNNSPGSASVLGRLSTSPTLLFAGDDGGTMRALALGSGFADAPTWTRASGAAIQSSSYYDHTTTSLQYGTDGGNLYCVLAGTGVPLTGYPYSMGASDPIRTAPLYYNGILVAGTTTGKLHFLDRNNGTSGPALIRAFYFGPTQAVSGIGYDANSSRFMVSVADAATKDGRLYYFDAADVADPTPNTK